MGAVLAAAMAYLRGRYNGGKFWKTVIDAIMCAVIAWFIRDVLDFFGMSTNLAYIGSVIIGYLGTDYLGQLLRRIIGNKTGE
ncbi:phage holin, lambda family [Photorhabdus akhurstii]|uniref:phage holin, lambda family n=1 Tax=Photorhabdus akhurstii TaxID=171438 RepID=UPI001FE91273|nr:phage holin, lambda family [Photorhabdus akhurstii]